MVPTSRIVLEILPHILVYLGSPELQRLGKTSRYLHALLAFRLRHLFDIDAFFGEFFRDPAGFRFLQECTGLLVSGSQALQFLDRARYGQGDLDLYVPEAWALVVIRWIILQGYIVLSSRSPFRHSTLSFDDVLKQARLPGSSYFLRPGHALFQFSSPCGSTKIDLIVTTGSPFSAICDFHSTAVMNFISATCAVCMFPRTTFVERLSLVVRAGTTNRMKCVLDKYASRGFKSTYSPTLSTSFSPGPRWIRDSRTCWLLPLPAVPQGPFRFWNLFFDELSTLRNDRFRQDLPYWFRMGYSLVIRGGKGKVMSVEFEYDGLHRYCIPVEFSRCLLVTDCKRLFSIVHEHMDNIVDETLLAVIPGTRSPVS